MIDIYNKAYILDAFAHEKRMECFEEERIRIIHNMIKNNLSTEEIADLLDMPIKEVENALQTSVPTEE